VRSDHQVTSKAVVVATGVTEDGRREILGIEIGDSEDEAFWREFLRSLKRRGLSGVRLVISDQHAGLVAAIGRCFQGAAHQRCRVHFARNLMANIPKGHQEMVSAAFRTIFAQVSPEEISVQWDHVAGMLTERFDKAAALMGRAKEEVLAFGTFPQVHWRQIWSTNPPERLNKEIKRRSRVVGIFPNGAAAIRLCGAVVLDPSIMHSSVLRLTVSISSVRRRPGDMEPCSQCQAVGGVERTLGSRAGERDGEFPYATRSRFDGGTAASARRKQLFTGTHSPDPRLQDPD
jgi:transposase-like protein